VRPALNAKQQIVGIVPEAMEISTTPALRLAA
jgi:hypothetical protein